MMHIQFSRLQNQWGKNKSKSHSKAELSRPAISAPTLLQGPHIAGVMVLKGPISAIRQEVEHNNQSRPFVIPQVELWEQGLNRLGIPIRDQAETTLINGKDLFLFCQQHNQGNPPQHVEPKIESRSHWNLLDCLFPAFRRQRNLTRLKSSIRSQDNLIENIKRFAKHDKNISGQPILRKSLGNQPEGAIVEEPSGTIFFLKII